MFPGEFVSNPEDSALVSVVRAEKMPFKPFRESESFYAELIVTSIATQWTQSPWGYRTILAHLSSPMRLGELTDFASGAIAPS